MVTFKIHLKEPGKRFASGDKVQGKVVFSSRSDQSVISVRVWFKGIAEPSNDHDNLTGNHHILFQHHCEVYSGDSVLLANTYEWPFEFVFPSIAKSDSPNPQWSVKELFEHEPGHPLPPSMWKFSWSGPSCYVEYQLDAQVQWRGRRYVLSGTTEVDYRPHVDAATFSYKRVQHKQTLKRFPTLVDIVKSMVHSNQSPSANIRAILDIPTVLAVGGPVPITLTPLDYPPDHVVRLGRIEAFAKTRTVVRTLRSEKKPPPKTDQLDRTSNDTLLDLFDLGLSRNQPVHLEKISKNPTVVSLTPGFQTFNIHQSYSLAIRASFWCMGVPFDLRLDDLPLTITPRLRRSHNLQESGS